MGRIYTPVWDALEIFYIYKNTKEATRALGPRQLGGIHVMKRNDSWTRVAQILDMDEDEFAAELEKLDQIEKTTDDEEAEEVI